MQQKFLAPDNPDFSEIITDRSYYVDKTHLIYQIASKNIKDNTKNYFLSRPKRFGKSLLIDTFQCLFEGKKDLFKDLYIYDKWDFEANTHPVIKFDFGDGEYTEKDGLKNRLFKLILREQKRHKIPDDSIDNSNSLISRLEDLIDNLYLKHNKQVVVLIDEYDSPILESLVVGQDIAEANRSMLSGFFGVLKASNKYIRFVFITGISMFPKAEMTSGLNNVLDITLNPEYSTICGFTEGELKTVFAPELKKLKNISFDEIKKYYNGYGWSGEEKNRVYNPYSIILLFVNQKIRPWWYESSNSSFFYNILKKFYVTPFQIEASLQKQSSLVELDIYRLNVQALFFQMGVLTIVGERYDQSNQAKKKMLYLLDYPNEEIREAFAEGVMADLLNAEDYEFSLSQAKVIVDQLKKNEFSKLKQTIEALFAELPFPWTKALENSQQVQLDKNSILRFYEGLYASVLYFSLKALGIKISKEVVSRIGISDIEIELGNQVFIVELKMLKIKDIDKALQNALQQIENKRYGVQHSFADKKVYGIAMVFDKKNSNIVGLKHKALFEGK